MLLRLAIEGVGIVRLGEIAVGRAIRKGLLKPLLRDFQEDAGYPLWAGVLPPGRQRAPKVKAFLDFLIDEFRKVRWTSRSPPTGHQRARDR